MESKAEGVHLAWGGHQGRAHGWKEMRAAGGSQGEGSSPGHRTVVIDACLVLPGGGRQRWDPSPRTTVGTTRSSRATLTEQPGGGGAGANLAGEGLG